MMIKNIIFSLSAMSLSTTAIADNALDTVERLNATSSGITITTSGNICAGSLVLSSSAANYTTLSSVLMSAFFGKQAVDITYSDCNNVTNVAISESGVGSSYNADIHLNGRISFPLNSNGVIYNEAGPNSSGYIWLQPGYGSAAAGGSVQMFGQVHPSFPGQVHVGLGNGIGSFRIKSYTGSGVEYAVFNGDGLVLNGDQYIRDPLGDAFVSIQPKTTNHHSMVSFMPQDLWTNTPWFMGRHKDGSFRIVQDTGIDSTNGMRLYSSGDMYVAGNYYTNSDQRLKNNIRPIKGALEKLAMIEGVEFNWKSPDEIKSYETDAENRLPHKLPNSKQIGFLAQQVEAMDSSLVKEGPNGIKAVSYTMMVPILVAAIKEQQVLIKDLQGEVAKLKSKIN